MRCAAADDACVSGRLRRGLCEKHYRRALKHGTTTSSRIDVFSHYDVAPTGCWIWRGARWRNGYGKTSVKVHGTRLAHRAFYVEHVGPIPDGLDLDHLCHNADRSCDRGVGCPHRVCVNPEHLQPTTRHTNLVRAIAAQETCENGLHDLTLPGATRPGTRQCVQCWRDRYRAAGKRYRERKRTSV